MLNLRFNTHINLFHCLQKSFPQIRYNQAFFTGMRFGEMAALKWRNIDIRHEVIRIRETRVRGEEGRPKTRSSVRDVKILPPVFEALREEKQWVNPNMFYLVPKAGLEPARGLPTTPSRWRVYQIPPLRHIFIFHCLIGYVICFLGKLGLIEYFL